MIRKNILALAMGLLALGAFAKAKKGKAATGDAFTLGAVERKAAKPGEGVYYSMFVRSFADSNKDGVGDFRGIIGKLDYLNDGDDSTTSDLGVTGIWLLPIFPSSSYHGYDVDDYYAVNPEYGTMEDFEKLCAECKKRGISLIIDMTLNHSSNYNSWFKASRKAEDEHRTWYRWITDLDFSDNGGAYNRGQKGFDGAIWKADTSTKLLDADGQPLLDKLGKPLKQYYAALFSTNMPDFNMDTQAVRDEFKKVFQFWFDKGVSGFRFDAAGHIYNANEVKPGSPTIDSAISFWREMNDAVVAIKPDAFTVAEVWEPTAIRAKYMGGMISNFDFDLGKFICDIINNQEMNEDGNVPPETDETKFNGFARSMKATYDSYAKHNPNYIDSPFLSNHDQPRSTAMLRNKLPKMKLAADMYILLEGTPFIYYGEEIAMKSGADDPSKRTPMVWDAKRKDKFTCRWTDNPLYERANVYNQNTVSVAEQEKDADSLLNHYKRVIRVKTAHPALFKGRLEPLSLGSPVLESYLMNASEEKAFVIHNVSSGNTVTAKLPEEVAAMKLVYSANAGTVIKDGSITIPPLTSVVLAQ